VDYEKPVPLIQRFTYGTSGEKNCGPANPGTRGKWQLNGAFHWRMADQK